MDMQLAELEELKLTELYKLAKKHQIPYYGQMKKKELIFAILRAQAEQSGLMFMQGVLDILPEGYGFLRPINYLPSTEDIYISASQIRKFDLRSGDMVSGKCRPPKENERYFGLLHVDAVNGEKPETAAERLHFPALTPLYPQKKIVLETAPDKTVNANYRFTGTSRPGPARPDRGPAESRQDIAAERNCQQHLAQIIRRSNYSFC